MSTYLSKPYDWEDAFGEVYRRTHEARETDDETARQAFLAVGLAGVGPGARVLDAPCGFGRHSHHLAGAGYDVVGVDRSAPSLEVASSRGRGDGPNPNFQRGDYRHLPLVDADFDAVLCLFSSLGYLTRREDKQVLAEFHRVLRPGARLVLDLAHRDGYVRAMRNSTTDFLDDGGIYIKRRAWDPSASTVHTQHLLIEPDGARLEWENSQRFDSVDVWLAALEAVGFTNVEVHGGLSRLDLAENLTERAVFICQKPALTLPAGSDVI